MLNMLVLSLFEARGYHTALNNGPSDFGLKDPFAPTQLLGFVVAYRSPTAVGAE
jgi:hypothetical protein